MCLIPKHRGFDLSLKLLFGRIETVHTRRTAYCYIRFNMIFAPYAHTKSAIIPSRDVQKLRSAMFAFDLITYCHDFPKFLRCVFVNSLLSDGALLPYLHQSSEPPQMVCNTFAENAMITIMLNNIIVSSFIFLFNLFLLSELFLPLIPPFRVQSNGDFVTTCDTRIKSVKKCEKNEKKCNSRKSENCTFGCKYGWYGSRLIATQTLQVTMYQLLVVVV